MNRRAAMGLLVRVILRGYGGSRGSANIRRLHAQGMYALMYFNATEAWKPWIMDSFDYGHDDGWSIQNGRTGYDLGWAINQIRQRCRALAKTRGKFLCWNGPYYSDLERDDPLRRQPGRVASGLGNQAVGSRAAGVGESEPVYASR